MIGPGLAHRYAHNHSNTHAPIPLIPAVVLVAATTAAVGSAMIATLPVTLSTPPRMPDIIEV